MVRLASAVGAIVGALAGHPAFADPAFHLHPQASTVIFASMEAGPAKTFASSGFKRAFGGPLDETGWRVFAKLGSGAEQIARRNPSFTTEAQFLLGHETRLGDGFLAVFAGVEHEALVESCGCLLTPRHRVGPRVEANLWAQPTSGSMIQIGASVSGASGRQWLRAAFGYRLPFDAYLGPEIEGFRQPGYDKIRIGVHLSELRLFGRSWRISAGVQRAIGRPVEAYATLGLYWLR